MHPRTPIYPIRKLIWKFRCGVVTGFSNAVWRTDFKLFFFVFSCKILQMTNLNSKKKKMKSKFDRFLRVKWGFCLLVHLSVLRKLIRIFFLSFYSDESFRSAKVFLKKIFSSEWKNYVPDKPRASLFWLSKFPIILRRVSLFNSYANQTYLWLACDSYSM